MVNIRKLEAELWESADLLRAGSKLTSNQYCMPVLGLIFLRYAFSRFKMVEREILKDRPMRNGRQMPVEASDFMAKSALYLPREAQYDWLVNLPDHISGTGIKNIGGQPLNSLGEAVNNAMELVEQQSRQLTGVLPKEYTIFSDELLGELLRIFNNSALEEVGGDIIGRIYEYFLNKFAKNIASDDGVFFTPKSLVKMIVNIIEPSSGILLDPACGSGGMFVQTGDFVNAKGWQANSRMTFYGQEKVEYNARLCLMNMAVHGLTGVIKSGDGANSFYHDAHNLEGRCNYVMANPPFNVDKVKAESAANAGRLPFGSPKENKNKEIGNANYLWISYFYAYLNESGRAGFVMASSSTDSQGSDKLIRERLVKTGHVDVMISVGNNFFYTKSLPCSLWFFDKGKPDHLKDWVLFIDARNYYTVVDRTLNEWSDWQLKNLNAIVWLYRGQVHKYKELLEDYKSAVREMIEGVGDSGLLPVLDDIFCGSKEMVRSHLQRMGEAADKEISSSDKKGKKKLKSEWEGKIRAVEEILTVVEEAHWLYNKFGEGIYKDIPGLCKVADIENIEAKGWSLTPGAYVGAAPAEDDGVDFKERMEQIQQELLFLQAESNQLMNIISQNMEEMGL